MAKESKKIPRIVWEISILALMFILVFSIQYSAQFFAAPEPQFTRTYASGSMNFNLTVISSGISGSFSSNNYTLDIISGDTGGVSENQNYKLLLGSSHLIYTAAIIGAPRFFEQTESPSNPSYNALQIYQFSTKILGETSIDYVKFSLTNPDGTLIYYTLNTGISRAGDIYIVNVNNLSAANYSYEWYARDLSGKSSQYLKNYAIKKADPGLVVRLNSQENNIAVSKGIAVNISAVSENNSDIFLALFINEQSAKTGKGAIDYLFNTSSYANGIYSIRVSAIGSQNWMDITVRQNITVASISYFNIASDPVNGSVFKPVQLYRFLSQWYDDVSDVVLEFNGVKYSYLKGQLIKAGQIYIKDFGNLSAGVYNYTWYANDTVGAITSLSQMKYVIKRKSTQSKLFIDSEEISKIYSKDSLINLTAMLDINDMILLKVIKPDSAIITGSGNSRYERLEALDKTGLYAITAEYSGSENYSNSNITRWIYVPSGPDTTPPFMNAQSQNRQKIFGGDEIILSADIADNALLDYAKLNIDNTGSYAIKETKFVNAPFKNITFVWIVPEPAASKSVLNWFILVNDSSNNIYATPSSSFSVYDWADKNYNREITIIELSNAIVSYLRGNITQVQISYSIDRWLRGGVY
ncbi:MAG: hypothetical protein HZB65_03565 [Candidatus Aenigmarchaeota archaeon]|nr:hypothetical protein [Candidatus Aenigmarchaeota archaeon]